MKKTELPCLLCLTHREHLLKNPTLPLKNRSTVSQKLRHASTLKETHGTMRFSAQHQFWCCAKIVPTLIRSDHL
jgi:hypothetical protein